MLLAADLWEETQKDEIADKQTGCHLSADLYSQSR